MLIDHHYRHPIDCCDEVAQVSIFLGVLCSVILGISDVHLILLWGSYLWCFGLHFGIPRTGICLFLGNIPWRRFRQPSKVPCLISIYTTGPLYLLLVHLAASSTSLYTNPAQPLLSTLAIVITNQSCVYLYATSPCYNRCRMALLSNHMSIITFTISWRACSPPI